MFALAPLVLLLNGLIGIAVSVGTILSGVDGGRGWAQAIAPIALYFLAVHIVVASLHYRSPYQFQTGYLVALSMFHLAALFMIAFGAVDVGGRWNSGAFTAKLESAGWHTILAMSSFSVGAALEMLRGARWRVPPPSPQQVKVIRHNAFWIGLGLLFASAVFFSWAIASYGNLLNYSRAEIFSAKVDTRGFGLFMMMFPAACVVLVISASSRPQKLFAMCVAAFAVLFFMLSGYRSSALFAGLVGVVLWRKTGRRIPTVLAVGGVVGVLLVISMIGILRNVGSYAELSAKDVAESYEKASFTSSLMEMGQTLGLLGHVIRLVPENDPYRYGRTYLNAVLDGIPNLGGGLDVGESRSTAKKAMLSGSQAALNVLPSDWMTFRILREQYDQGFGVGFSAIGEAFLNFGTFGVFLVFFIHGWLLNNADRRPVFASLPRFIFLSAMLIPLFGTVRNDFAIFTKPAAFITLFILFWMIGMRVLGRYQKMPRRAPMPPPSPVRGP